MWGKKNKYGANKTMIDGIWFDSRMESRYYMDLKILQRANKLKIVELQPKVYLTLAKILFKPDFLIEENGKMIWIDVKGMKTTTFAIKQRLWRHYGPGLLRVVYKDKIVETEAINGK